MEYQRLTWLLKPFLDLMVPEKCRVCHSYQHGLMPEPICGVCLAEVNYLGPYVCRQCGRVLRSRVARDSLCGECIRKPPPWDKAISAVRYEPVIRELLSRLKYNADTTVLPALEAILRPFVHSLDFHPQHVIPVPLHLHRLRHRGMNQAVYLARLLFPEQPQSITTTLLQRHRPTLPQTGLDGVTRRKNLRGAFQLPDRSAVRGMSICLVDDVYTTGTTVAECSRVLRKAGASEIRVITVARVVTGG